MMRKLKLKRKEGMTVKVLVLTKRMKRKEMVVWNLMVTKMMVMTMMVMTMMMKVMKILVVTIAERVMENLFFEI